MKAVSTKAVSILSVWITLIGLSIPTTASAQGYDSEIPEWLQQRLVDRVLHRRDSNAMMRLVSPIASKASGGVVEVTSGGLTVALGTVVDRNSSVAPGSPSETAASPDNREIYIITKRSELSGDPVRIRLASDQLVPARVAAVRRRSDLALLVAQVDSISTTASLTPVRFQPIVPAIGSFLISPDRSGRVVGLGVIGAAPRRVDHKGRLGIELESVSDIGARVRNIMPDSGADEAGLERGDRIIAIDGRNQSDLRQVVSTLNSMFPGEVVRLTIERDGSRVDIPARLQEFALMQESENDARVNGARSIRLSGFDQAIQHDTVLNPDQCGGPVLDADGHVIGINIARAGRVVGYALPASLVASEVSSMIAEAGGR